MKIEILEYLKLVVNSHNVDMKIVAKDERLWIGESLYPMMDHRMEIEKEIEQGILYYALGFFEEEYCIFRIPEGEEKALHFVVIGPYKKNVFEHYEFHELLKNYQITPSAYKEIEEYYNSIPIITNDNTWFTMISSTLKLLYEKEQIKVQFLEGIRKEGESEFELPCTQEEKALSFQLIEQRYQIEQEILLAVSQGNTEKALEFLGQLNKYQITRRYKEKNRNYRNLLISFNTLCRKSVESSCVHPVYIDELSAKFAKQIETICSEREAAKLKMQMIRKYCILVKNYSLKGYSPFIQKIINYIEMNLDSELTLKALAEKFSVNASYLSDVFKKEVGETLTSYVNHKRIKKAIFYLNTSQMQVQEIAGEVGIVDSNYFIKLFKKIVGKTPKEYRNSILMKA